MIEGLSDEKEDKDEEIESDDGLVGMMVAMVTILSTVQFMHLLGLRCSVPLFINCVFKEIECKILLPPPEPCAISENRRHCANV